MPVDPLRTNHIIVEFEEPITLDHLRIIRSNIEHEVLRTRLPSVKSAYRAYSDGFGRLVNTNIGVEAVKSDVHIQ